MAWFIRWAVRSWRAVGRGPRTCAALRALPGMLSVRGDIETVVTFHVDQIAAVLAILKPYRRRQLTEAQKRQNAERAGEVPVCEVCDGRGHDAEG